MHDSHDAEGEILFIGTATVLLRYGGFTLLTDPNFLHQGEHARLGYGLRSRRLTEPALSIAELPSLDLIVLSHHHGDHFDDRAADELDKTIPIVTTPHAAKKLERQGFRHTIPLTTWQQTTFDRGTRTLRVTSLPGRHGPPVVNALLPPVMGSMLEFEDQGTVDVRVYLTGDTLVHDDLREIPARYHDIHLALIHLGGTRILGITLTMDARQGVEALRIVRPGHAIPIHYDDYTVFKSPLEDFERALAGASVPTEVHVLRRGERFSFSASSLS
jgi:L-ascorbate metabolism protein UlaG (beta-lactamase superfamily)